MHYGKSIRAGRKCGAAEEHDCQFAGVFRRARAQQPENSTASVAGLEKRRAAARRHKKSLYDLPGAENLEPASKTIKGQLGIRSRAVAMLETTANAVLAGKGRSGFRDFLWADAIRSCCRPG